MGEARGRDCESFCFFKSVIGRPANDLMGIPAKYGRQPDAYYFLQGDNPPAKLTSLKNFLALIPDKAEQVEKYARNEKISFEKESDLKRLVEYVNSLKDL